MTINNLIILFCISQLGLTGCSVSADPGQARYKTEENAVNPTLADPSIKKCIDDGYRPISVKQDGITRSYLCINPLSNAKCDSWRYFRGECSLTVPSSDESIGPTQQGEVPKGQ
ncbi:MAG: hypothetical protein PHH11_04005 [Methylomonas sp.]|nr:hypothetical protein [Methylomonas sp.]